MRRLSMCVFFGVVSVALAAVPTPLFEHGAGPIRVGAWPKPSKPTYHPLSAKQCARCHARIYRQWKASRHAQAFTNQIFAVSFHDSPYRWCIHCHAPLSAQREALRPQLRDGHLIRAVRSATSRPAGLPTTRPTSQRARSSSRRASALGRQLVREGVTCVACHWRQGHLLVAKKPSAVGRVAHPRFLVDKRLSSSQFCAGCHQFNMIKALHTPGTTTKLTLQNTYKEWLGSRARQKGLSCQRCHMPKGAHRFPGAHHKGLMQRSLSMHVSLLSAQRARVVVKAKGVGHATPTGDPFRRMRIDLCADAACKSILAQQWMQKVQKPVKGGGYVIHRDTRIPTPTTSMASQIAFVLSLKRPLAKGQKLHWRLVYLFAEYHHHSRLKPHNVRSILTRGTTLFLLP